MYFNILLKWVYPFVFYTNEYEFLLFVFLRFPTCVCKLAFIDTLRGQCDPPACEIYAVESKYISLLCVVQCGRTFKWNKITSSWRRKSDTQHNRYESFLTFRKTGPPVRRTAPERRRRGMTVVGQRFLRWQVLPGPVHPVVWFVCPSLPGVDAICE